jgi:hypothetical protein
LGLFTQCRLARYLDSLEPAHIESLARVLLSALFESLHVRRVHVVGAVLSTDEALNRFAGKLSSFEIKHQPIQGVTFGLDTDKNIHSRWNLFLEGGVLPELNLYTYHGTGFRPPPEWPEAIMRTAAVSALWLDGRGSWGRSEGDLYLACKRSRLGRSLFLGVPHPAAATAGLELRQICQTVQTMKASHRPGSVKLSRWFWQRRRFLRTFDKILINRLGVEKLAAMLRTAGLEPDQWLLGN